MQQRQQQSDTWYLVDLSNWMIPERNLITVQDTPVSLPSYHLRFWEYILPYRNTPHQLDIKTNYTNSSMDQLLRKKPNATNIMQHCSQKTFSNDCNKFGPIV